MLQIRLRVLFQITFREQTVSKKYWSIVLFKQDKKSPVLYRIGPFEKEKDVEIWCDELRQTAIDTHDDLFGYPQLLINPAPGIEIHQLKKDSPSKVIEAIWEKENPSVM